MVLSQKKEKKKSALSSPSAHLSARNKDKYRPVKHKPTLRDFILCGMFAALTAIMAQIRITVPFSVVPVTLQTFAVFMSAILLGGRNASLSMLIYILMGAAGAPVFSGFAGGLSILTGPAGGYLIAFPLSAYVTGTLISRSGKKSAVNVIVAMTAGMFCYYIPGTIYMGILMRLSPARAFIAGFVTFLPFDIIKLLAAAFAGLQIKRILPRIPGANSQ